LVAILDFGSYFGKYHVTGRFGLIFRVVWGNRFRLL
jgi:hypothetical protein